MSQPALAPRHRRTRLGAIALTATLCLAPAATSSATPHRTLPSAAVTTISIDDDQLPGADIGFRDLGRDGKTRPLRNDLTGALSGEVELAQSSSVAPTGNSAAEMPVVVAERTALLLFSPKQKTTSVTVQVRVGSEVQGTLTMNHPRRIPATDQNFDARGSVAYSLRAWSVELPWNWVRPGLNLVFTDGSGKTGTVPTVDVGAPTELVINNIRLGMLTDAPVSNGHRFITNPAWGASDYFDTTPVSRLVMAQYETVELDKVIVASGAIYTKDSPSPAQGGVYSGDMRENVGKAQVSTGINLATFGITSSPMNQSQPGITNQRVIHHSAGLYANGRQTHGLSGGNGMATLYDSVGNELSHELGHSYGLGHYPGMRWNLTGDEIARHATHHLESGWGYIAHRGLMRSNLSTNAFAPTMSINGATFTENLAGRYNFNTDTMAGGWDASPVSDYTHVTGYSQKRIQSSLKTLTADTAYPSGYRDWDATAGRWVDAKAKTPSFNRPRPAKVGVPVRTILGGYNPADPSQALLYPAFRSNYGVTFDLPQAAVTGTSATRVCWAEITFRSKPTQHVQIDASNGVKQVNINVAEADKPTGAQLACRQDGVTTLLGNRIKIDPDLPAMAAPVVVGQEAGYEALRTQELKAMTPRLEALAGDAVPVLSASDQIALRGWSDDLSALSPAARKVAERAQELADQATLVSAFAAQHSSTMADAAASGAQQDLLRHLTDRGFLDSPGRVLPRGAVVTVDGGKCLTLAQDEDGTTSVHVTPKAADCTGSSAERWFADVSGRIHPADRPELCLKAASPTTAEPCSLSDAAQRWTFEPDGHIMSVSRPGSALDLNRQTNKPILYSRTSGSNQIWRGLSTSGNTLLGALSSRGLTELWAAAVPSVRIDTSHRAAASGWHTRATTVTATAVDAFATAQTPTVEISSGEGWAPYTAPVRLPEGTTTVQVRATTTAGRAATVSRTFKVDTVAPKSTATINPAGLTITAQDATSGVRLIEYRVGSAAWKKYDAPVRLSATRTTVQVRATDAAGNVEPAVAVTTSSSPVRVVASAPKVTYGKSGRLTVRVTARDGKATPTGTVQVLRGSRVLGKATLAKGKASVTLPARKLPVGTRSLTVRYSGDARHATTSPKATVKVVRSSSTSKLTVRKTVARGKGLTAKLRVAARTKVAVQGSATVRVTRAGKTVHTGKVRVSKGRANVRIPGRAFDRRGTYKVTVTYKKGTTVASSRTTAKVRVR